MNDLALWLKALHIVAIVAWMAALLYLPRLFVYHSKVAPGTEASDTFKIMERRLLKAIMTPAMLASLLFGILLESYKLSGPRLGYTSKPCLLQQWLPVI